MTVKEMKTLIQDLPDDMQIGAMDDSGMLNGVYDGSVEEYPKGKVLVLDDTDYNLEEEMGIED